MATNGNGSNGKRVRFYHILAAALCPRIAPTPAERRLEDAYKRHQEATKSGSAVVKAIQDSCSELDEGTKRIEEFLARQGG
jgi:hypothetical protein